MARKIRYGMVGGGRGAFIGAVHRIAAALDQQIDLVCGAFSSDPATSQAIELEHPHQLINAPEHPFGPTRILMRAIRS